MSSASSRSQSGDVNFFAPSDTKSGWIPWAIGGAVVLILVLILTKGKN